MNIEEIDPVKKEIDKFISKELSIHTIKNDLEPEELIYKKISNKLNKFI